MCRTDLQICEGDLAAQQLPITPGHQVVGRVAAVGGEVDTVAVGDRVGVAWIASTCGRCRFCTSGRENLCDAAQFTGWSRDGGFAERVTARADFVMLQQPTQSQQDARRPAPTRTRAQLVGYDVLRVLARAVAVWLFGLRVVGRQNWPATGGALVCANHQSHFDPPMIGMTCPRRMNFLARDTLFRTPGFKQLIEFFDAIPIDREGGGLAGLKAPQAAAALRRAFRL